MERKPVSSPTQRFAWALLLGRAWRLLQYVLLSADVCKYAQSFINKINLFSEFVRVQIVVPGNPKSKHFT